MSGVVGIDASLAGTTLATGVERLVSIRDQVAIRVSDAKLVVLEGYAFARPNQAHQIGELGGVLRVAMHELGVRWVEVAPRARAKWATGKGNSSKDAVVSAVSARTGLTFDSNDHCDAWVLRDIGVVLSGGKTQLGDLTVARREVLSKLGAKS
jgi:crossover junction endodeoxyribonuclease RuvC